MINIPDDLADLLLLWWLAERRGATAMLGMPRECPSTRGYRSGGHWDAENGVDEAHSRSVLVQAVSRAVDALQVAERCAAHLMARNLATGAQVWDSARLPADERARELVFMDAVRSLHRRLGLDTPIPAVA